MKRAQHPIDAIAKLLWQNAGDLTPPFWAMHRMLITHRSPVRTFARSLWKTRKLTPTACTLAGFMFCPGSDSGVPRKYIAAAFEGIVNPVEVSVAEELLIARGILRRDGALLFPVGKSLFEPSGSRSEVLLPLANR